MNAALWAALAVVGVLAVLGGWLAAEMSCRARWRRYAAAGSLPLPGRHTGRRRGRRGGAS